MQGRGDRGVKRGRPIPASNDRAIAPFRSIHRPLKAGQGIILSPENHPSVPSASVDGTFLSRRGYRLLGRAAHPAATFSERLRRLYFLNASGDSIFSTPPATLFSQRLRRLYFLNASGVRRWHIAS